MLITLWRLPKRFLTSIPFSSSSLGLSRLKAYMQRSQVRIGFRDTFSSSSLGLSRLKACMQSTG
jgi:hypothetical protein